MMMRSGITIGPASAASPLPSATDARTQLTRSALPARRAAHPCSTGRRARAPLALPSAPPSFWRRQQSWRCAAAPNGSTPEPDSASSSAGVQEPPKKVQGASTDLTVILARLAKLAMPYWTDPVVGSSARWKLAAVVGLTLATTGVSVVFNFLGRDFFNALSEKDEVAFGVQMTKYLGAFVVGIPVFVFKSYYQSKLSLEWRAWMTERLMDDYFDGRTFYSLQAKAAVDNPDQRISSDVAAFTGTAMNLALVLLNATLDLVSFSGILYSIYPPLFAALITYSVTGTALSIWLGKPLVGLNFSQEAREADLRYGLVRVRENAEAVAFYRGEEDEKSLLQERLKAAVSNYMGLLVASRNLDFFTSFYRYLIQLLPAAVVAPLFFQGKIEFGVINQSQSAFNHVLNDLSLVVYQFESLAGFSAVVDRLGQFQEAMHTVKQPDATPLALPAPASAPTATASTSNGQDASAPAPAPPTALTGTGAAGGGVGSSEAAQLVSVEYVGSGGAARLGGGALLELSGLSVVTPDGSNLLVQDLDLQLAPGGSLLLMGPSGAGKTSLLRTLAGLWTSGRGAVRAACDATEVMFLPQKPYMVLGSLRDQVLYPTFAVAADKATKAMIAAESADEGHELPTASSRATSPAASGAEGQQQGQPSSKRPPPPDADIERVLRTVRLGHLLSRYQAPGAGQALDSQVDWASSLSLGEQQRIAWARLLLAGPRLALLDEATSALDQATEEELYQVLASSGITYVSVGHRSTLRRFHSQVLQLAPTTPPASPQAVLAGGGASSTPAVATRPSNSWELLASNRMS